jgi:branched-chain amino acid transport system substrate-binding protein
MNRTIAAAAAALGFAISGTAIAQNEQFVPANFYWVGPYAPGGSGFGGGIIDYMQMLNERDGGINGVKLTWEKCETEYNNARGVECYERSKKKGPTGATVVHPLSTGITYSIIEKATADKIPVISMGYGRTSAADGRVFPYVFPLITTYWSQATVMVKFMGQKNGGMDKWKGKKVALVYHDSAYGKEPIPVLTDMSKQYGFELTTIAVPHPGNEQQAQWLQIRQLKPDWVILWGWGVMNPTALKAAAKIGYPREKIVGVWWSGAEEDVLPAGSAAKGFISAGFNAPGTEFPVMKDIKKFVYDKGKGEFEDKSRFGSIYHTRGVVAGIVTAEAIRVAQAKFGKGKPIMISDASTAAFWPWMKAKFGFDDAQIRKYTFNLAPFVSDPKAIQEGYLSSEPYTVEKQAGFKPQIFLLADYGYPGYANMVLVPQKWIEENPKAVQAFVDASIEGWKQYLWGDPTPADKIIKRDNPEMTDDVIAQAREKLKSFGVVTKDGLGQMSDAGWKTFFDTMSAVGIYDKSMDWRDAYDLRFVRKK